MNVLQDLCSRMEYEVRYSMAALPSRILTVISSLDSDSQRKIRPERTKEGVLVSNHIQRDKEYMYEPSRSVRFFFKH